MMNEREQRDCYNTMKSNKVQNLFLSGYYFPNEKQYDFTHNTVEGKCVLSIAELNVSGMLDGWVIVADTWDEAYFSFLFEQDEFDEYELDIIIKYCKR